MRTQISIALAAVTLCSGSAFGQQRTRDGATVGGVAGAVIGGIIGHQNDETPEGALIGGAVGAIAGGLLGKAQDNALQQQRYQQEQAYYQAQQQAYVQQQAVVNSGVSINDMVNMARSGVSESLIISQLQTKGVQRRLEVSEIIALHQQGVSDTLISAMQSAPLATQVSGPQPTQYTAPRRQVIVQQPDIIFQEQPVIYRSPVLVERYYTPYPVYRSHYNHHHRRGSSVYFGF